MAPTAVVGAIDTDHGVSVAGSAVGGGIHVTYAVAADEPAEVSPVKLERLSDLRARFVALGDDPTQGHFSRARIVAVTGPPHTGRRTAALVLAHELNKVELAKRVFLCRAMLRHAPVTVLKHACKNRKGAVLVAKDADEWVAAADWDDEITGVLEDGECRLILTARTAARADKALVLRTHRPNVDEQKRLFINHGAALVAASPGDLEAAWERVKPILAKGDDSRRTPAAIEALWRRLGARLLAAGDAPTETELLEGLGDRATLEVWFDVLKPQEQLAVVLAALFFGLETGRLAETMAHVLREAGFVGAQTSSGVWMPTNDELRPLRLVRSTEAIAFDHPGIVEVAYARLGGFGFLLEPLVRAARAVLTEARRGDVAWRHAFGRALGRLGTVRRPEFLGTVESLVRDTSVNVAGYALVEACTVDRALVPQVTALLGMPGFQHLGGLFAAMHTFPTLVDDSGVGVPRLLALADRSAVSIERLYPNDSDSNLGKRLRSDLRRRLEGVVRAAPASAASALLERLKDGRTRKTVISRWLAEALIGRLRSRGAIEQWGLDLLAALLQGGATRHARAALLGVASVDSGVWLRRLAWHENVAVIRVLGERLSRLLSQALENDEEVLAPDVAARLGNVAVEADLALGLVRSADPTTVAAPRYRATATGDQPRRDRLTLILEQLATLPDRDGTAGWERLVRLWARAARAPDRELRAQPAQAVRADRQHLPLRRALARAALLCRLRDAGSNTNGSEARLRGECRALRAACDVSGPQLWAQLQNTAQAAGVPVMHVPPGGKVVPAVLLLHGDDAPSPASSPQTTARRRPVESITLDAPAIAADLARNLEQAGFEVVPCPITKAPVPLLAAELDDERRSGFDLVVVVAAQRFEDADDWRAALGPRLLLLEANAAQAGAFGRRAWSEQGQRGGEDETRDRLVTDVVEEVRRRLGLVTAA